MAQTILLFTDDIDGAKREIGAVEGHVAQQFTDNVFVATLPDSVDPLSLEVSTPEQPSALDPVSELAAGAWHGLQDKHASDAPSASEGLSWDAVERLPPDRPEDVDPNGTARARDSPDMEPQLSTGTPTSLYMTGSVAVGVVIVSGTQSGLDITAAEQQTVIQEVQEGLDFLANAEPRAKLSFVYDIHLITVSTAPGPTTSYEAAEGPWRNAATQAMGFSADRQGSIDYVEDLRQRNGSSWAYVAYFTKYPLRHFAYAVSEKTVMHFDNDGWGTNLINRVFAHETCHIFGAADEYGSCSCGGSHGFLGVPNNNCRNCAGTQVSCMMDGNVLEMCDWSRMQIGWDESLFPDVFSPLSLGHYTIQQRINSRFMDAHEISSKDYSVVTRTAQSNDTQRWRLTPVGNLYTLQQVSNGRFLDAHVSSSNDFSVVTRTAQNDDTQRWVFQHSPNHPSTYTIQQLVNGRYLDAWETSRRDFNVVTRTAQNNDSQRWIVNPLGDNVYSLQQVINGRYLDAHESLANDFNVVTRTDQSNDTQRWLLTPIGGVYTLQQVSNGRFLDAHVSSSNDFSVVTRTAQTNDSQRWAIQAVGNDTFTIQQLVNGQHLDAWETSTRDFNVVTRAAQNNDSQRWTITPV
jgi:hypothetical protein